MNNERADASPPQDVSLLARDGFLMALVPPSGPRPDLMAVRAFLKLLPDHTITIQRSELEFIDEFRQSIEKRPDAFGLKSGTELTGPYSQKTGDDNRRPPGAVQMRWHLNHISLETKAFIPAPGGTDVRVIYLPVQVPVAEDYHLMVTIINQGIDPLNIADGMREAVFHVDGKPCFSTAGRHWNGSYLILPQRANTRYFRLSDFPGAPRAGIHECSLEILGIRSLPQIVSWTGQPWIPNSAFE